MGDYGKSMYGGWYANVWSQADGKYIGYHENTLKALKERVGEVFGKLRRWDNAL